ncbi:hypothetical protein WSS15_28150 [Acetobacter pasteurianus]|uniref:Uncharacterized protein n=3 Tax=Acetobacter TaxID=434 RepID=A0A401WYM0_ACEPA|nr:MULTISPECIES: hypothetical protein [Acetobacter]PHY94178.1 hypothetical protein CSR02_07725 [Acetobacter pomorum]GBR54358.1 hypothetical protein AA11825_2660 [Acetobacter pomorum DSM 11825]GCD54462.1 hypothetical protein NBRC3188_3159 [Acetobacter pasteurianus NBRC 3188]GCD60115.1 hypothetical protein NBRC3277_2690 [Acetobacter pasteurianus NBRC 3277]GCD63598.1 hypothetical protein NBRC3278_2691 [Acetobacter pasteurianus NBRC 3278]
MPNKETAPVVPATTTNNDIKVRIGSENTPSTITRSLSSLVDDMRADPKTAALAEGVIFNIRHYGHATISPSDDQGPVRYAELTDLPEGWSFEPEKHGRSCLPFASA